MLFFNKNTKNFKFYKESLPKSMRILSKQKNTQKNHNINLALIYHFDDGPDKPRNILFVESLPGTLRDAPFQLQLDSSLLIKIVEIRSFFK